jgi:pentatricopeptide repeat protein
MRTSGAAPIPGTTHPIFTAISHDTDALDATWDIMEDIRKEEKPLDIAVLNVMIQAAVSLGDLQRAIGIYKAYPDYNVIPTVETYNLLLTGCVRAGHRELGDRLLVEMKESGVKPDAETYENLICLCLTQPAYEDAFFYLEEMKSTHRPSRLVYETLTRKCFASGDIRYKLALEEMKECGYKVPSDLRLAEPRVSGAGDSKNGR